jgi:hypothetical protein
LSPSPRLARLPDRAREPLQTLAYFILTVVEGSAGDRKQAAASFNIEFNVPK